VEKQLRLLLKFNHFCIEASLFRLDLDRKKLAKGYCGGLKMRNIDVFTKS